MAHENKVIQSVNLEGEHQCVDVFMRPGGTFGYELYRWDPEDGRGWYAIGHFSARKFESERYALEDACDNIPWLEERLDRVP